MTPPVSDPREAFLELARRALVKRPECQDKFEEHWKAHEYRLAYLVLHDAYPDDDYVETDADRKTDEAFYWLYVA